MLLSSSCISKLYSIILLNRLTEEASKRQLISVNQIGFQICKRTTGHIFVLQTLIDKIVKHEKWKLFVAFRKAYDAINRNVLHNALMLKPITGMTSSSSKQMENLKSLNWEWIY